MKKLEYLDVMDVSERNETLTTPVGDEWHIEYTGVYDENGNIVLRETGKSHIPTLIDADRESCDINNIIKRFTLGDTEALSARQGFYADVSEAPKTYAQMLNMINAAKEEFDMLPLEVREKYDFDVAKFICSRDIGMPVNNDNNRSEPSEVKVEEVGGTDE